jgi:hypothetical protein
VNLPGVVVACAASKGVVESFVAKTAYLQVTLPGFTTGSASSAGSEVGIGVTVGVDPVVTTGTSGVDALVGDAGTVVGVAGAAPPQATASTKVNASSIISIFACIIVPPDFQNLRVPGRNYAVSPPYQGVKKPGKGSHLLTARPSRKYSLSVTERLYFPGLPSWVQG